MSNNYSNIEGLFSTGEMRDKYISTIGGKCGSENSPACFSFKFKEGNKKDNEGNTGDSLSTYINTFPSDLAIFLEKDSAWNEYVKLNYNDFISQIPNIQIRAFVPDTIIQYAQGILETAFAAYNYAINTDLNTIYKDIADELGETSDNIKNFFSGLFSEDGRSTFINALSSNFSNMKFRTGNRKQYDFHVLDLPWNLYYRIMGSTTNAIYEVPSQFPENVLNSNGSYGWSNSEKSSFSSLQPKNSSKNTNTDTNATQSKEQSELKVNVFKTIFSTLTNKLNLTVMPFFNPNAESGQENFSFEINFDLVNDTIEHAKNNFAFVQTLIANNKWIQSFIFTNPSNLYDVKLPSGQRFFMCTGNFSVTYKGTIKKIKNNQAFKPFGKETRIPEIYSVKMIFKSLLPENFNTYMMGMLKANKNMFEEYNSNRKEPGVIKNINTAFSNAISSTISLTKSAPNSTEDSTSDSTSDSSTDSNTTS